MSDTEEEFQSAGEGEVEVGASEELLKEESPQIVDVKESEEMAEGEDGETTEPSVSTSELVSSTSKDPEEAEVTKVPVKNSKSDKAEKKGKKKSQGNGQNKKAKACDVPESSSESLVEVNQSESSPTVTSQSDSASSNVDQSDESFKTEQIGASEITLDGTTDVSSSQSDVSTPSIGQSADSTSPAVNQSADSTSPAVNQSADSTSLSVDQLSESTSISIGQSADSTTQSVYQSAESSEKDDQSADNFSELIDQSADSTSKADDSTSKTESVTSSEDVKENPVESKKEVTSIFDKLASRAEQKSSPPVRDDREENVLEKLSRAGEQKQQASGWGSWGSWGSSILNTATSSINTFTGQVSEGVHAVVDTFEASVGAPPADVLASEISQHVKEPSDDEKVIPKEPQPSSEKQAEVEKEVGDKQTKSTGDEDWFASWGVSGITNQLQNKTKGLVESGLDVLETIGKKTMEQIQETDPGFAKTKGLLRGNKTNLSQTLREAKEENERKAAEESNAAPLTTYSSLFDKHQGLACLEALELLSITSTNCISNTEGTSDETQNLLDTISDKFTTVYDSDEDCEEEHDFAAGMEDFVSKIMLPVKHSRMVEVQAKARTWLVECQKRQDKGERVEGREIHSEALNSFAELTSATMELCHKSAALLSLSVEETTPVDVTQVSDALVSAMRLVTNEISLQSNKFNECLNTAADDSEHPESINPMITDVFMEASNSTSYVRDAFKLLLPTLHKCVLAAQ